MKQFLFVGNGPSLNRGCEAITKGTIRILRKTFGSDIRFVSIDFSDGFQSTTTDPALTHQSMSVKRFSPSWFARSVWRALPTPPLWLPMIASHLEKSQAVLALGGDNYSMDYGSLRVHLDILDYIQHKGYPFVIWGASVGKFEKKGATYREVVADKLRHIPLILARESVTVDYLASIGVEANVRRVADPAFVMEPTAPDSFPLEIVEGTIGFNFSPLMAKFITKGDVVAAQELVTTLLRAAMKATERPFLLIPHVFKDGNNDHTFLQQPYQILKKEGFPIQLLPPTLSASEIKWVMNQLSVFAGARTHSTIAAISSGIPTLSFSYSIKSIGLNKDVFGHDEFVIRPEEISPQRTVAVLSRLVNEEPEVRVQLQNRLPHIKKLAFQSGVYLQELLTK